MPQIQAGAVIYAKDLLKIAEFYKSIAALEVRETEKDFIKLESDTFQLIVLQAPKYIAEAIVIDEPQRVREETPIKLIFFVSSIRQARATAKELGGALYDDEKTWVFENYNVCDGYDPEGNVFQLRALSPD